MESSSTRFRPSVPLPVPLDAVTVQFAPLPDTFWIDGEPPRPVFANAKSAEPTPVTLSLKTTAQPTLALVFVGLVPARLIERTVEPSHRTA